MSHTILLPSQLHIVSEEENNGVYSIEGLYPGYGHTLGNSLRRIILSSLPGAAVVGVKIDGVDHEFSTISGVKEDAMTILLNLKKVRFKMLTEETQTAMLKISGAKVVTAADIDAGGQLEVLNPDQPICELTDKNAKIDMEITVQSGMGFVPRAISKKDSAAIGEIKLDAVFSPIRKVSYEVENMRVGDRTDYNRLRIAIQTDGTLTPREALEESIKVMITQLRAVLNLETTDKDLYDEPEPIAIAEDTDTDEAAETPGELQDYDDILKTRIDTLELSTRTQNALADASIRTIRGLARKTEDELLALDGLGKKGIDEIREVLLSFDIKLKDDTTSTS